MLTKPTQMQATALIAIIFLAILSLYYFSHNQRLTTKSTAKPPSPSTVALTTASAMSAAPHVSNDSNWAGYIIASDLQNPQAVVTSISASWIVPAVAISPQDTFAAVWIGIGGYFDPTLIQVGTEQDYINGTADYFAWFEFLPESSIIIETLTVSPGDQMNASIQLINSRVDAWSIYIKDLTTSQEFNYNLDYASSQLSAEWIVERPEVGRRLATLADNGKVTFANCQATVGAKSGTISSFSAIQSIMYYKVQNTSGVTQLAAVSDLTDNGSSFTVETSASAIPELPVWALLPIIMGTALFAAIAKKCHARTHISTGAGARRTKHVHFS
jgi:hypothetical protein